VVLGPQDDEFDPKAKALLFDSEWRISATSDRMGYRLEGPALRHLHGHNIVSDGTVDGSIQVPGNGAPIVLMRDRGTTGGYPKIAAVITADFGVTLRSCSRACRIASAPSKILISTSKRCMMPTSPAMPSARWTQAPGWRMTDRSFTGRMRP
jgi:hypothetical protein